jgi:hypothetical protein
MGSLTSDHLLGVRIGGGAGDQITGNIAGGQAAQSQDSDEHVSEILADACAQSQRIGSRRVHVHRALLVGEVAVDETRRALGEAGDELASFLTSAVKIISLSRNSRETAIFFGGKADFPPELGNAGRRSAGASKNCHRQAAAIQAT